MSARVSVITPLFGHAEYITPMLHSLQGQTMPNWECCVVIDGTDHKALFAVQAVAAADDRVTCIMTAAQRGVAAARNTAVRNTTAPWLLPFDADDMMHPTYIASLLAKAEFEESDRAPVVYAAAECLRPNGQSEVFSYPTFDAGRFTDYFQIPNSSLHPRELWEALDGWDEEWRHGAEDWHYWARAVAADIIAPCNIKAALWTYREHNGARNSRLGREFWPEHKAKIDEILSASA